MQLNRIYAGHFLLYLLIGFVILRLASTEILIDDLCLVLAKTIAWLLSTIDSGVARHGAVVLRNTWGYALEITRDCSALTYWVTLVAAILATPITMAQRLLAMVAAIFFIQIINVFRLISLLYIKVALPLPLFNSIHEQAWPLIMGFLTVCFFVVWIRHHEFLLSKEQSSNAALSAGSISEVNHL